MPPSILTTNQPPGLTGDYADILMRFSHDPLSFLTTAAQTYGDIVQIGPNQYLLVHPRDIETVFVQTNTRFAKLALDTKGRLEQSAFPWATMNTEGPVWLQKRRHIQPFFQRQHVFRMLHTMHNDILMLLDTWLINQPTNLQHRLMELSLTLICRFLFHRTLPGAAQRIHAAVDAIMQITRSPIRIPSFIPTPANLRLRKSMRQLDQLIDEIIATPSDDASMESILTLLQNRLHDAWGETFIRDELATLLLSGHETTANAIAWACVLIAHHPEVEQRIVDDVALMMHHGCLQLDQLGELKYTTAVVNEALRLYPPAWITSRRALVPCQFGDYSFKEQTSFTISPWVTHRDERFFVEPTVFNPQRWLRDDARSISRYAFIPFGTGPRVCIGEDLARLEMLLTITLVVSRYHIEVLPTSDCTPFPALALRPTKLNVILRPRKSN